MVNINFCHKHNRIDSYKTFKATGWIPSIFVDIGAVRKSFRVVTILKSDYLYLWQNTYFREEIEDSKNKHGDTSS